MWTQDPHVWANAGESLERAISSLSHRGPDGHGKYLKDGFALGHTRLSIIDVSTAASQPMRSPDDRYALIFNGEIYNYKSLYARYCSREVNGNSDTAVLLDLLSRFGPSCLPWLDGMYAFAFVDMHAKTVLLARDRFGEKPLYYRFDAGTLSFSSELRTLRLLMRDKAWALSENAVGLYHVMGSIPAPATIYQDVHALAPAQFVLFDTRFTRPAPVIYWSLGAANEARAQPASVEEATEVTRALLVGAVRSRLVSDVPVALFLSGGFDSSALMSCCAALGHPQKLAVCVDFEEEQFSEYQKAAAVARHYGATVHRHVVTQSSFEQTIDEFFSSMDQPTADGYNTFFVCRAASNFGIKVWLSGVGGDELFGGYSSFSRMTRWSAASRLLQRAFDGRIIDRMSPHLQSKVKTSRILHMSQHGDARLRAYQACRNPLPVRNAGIVLGFNADRREKLSAFVDAHYPDCPPSFDDFQAATLFESSVYMRSQLLRDIDNFSMAHSLELRAPFLDARLFQSVLSMDRKYKARGNTIKPLLGKAVPIAFPSEILDQRKQGFGFPVDLWLRKGVDRWFLDIAQRVESAGLWNRRAIDELWGAYQSRKVHWSVIWNLFAFGKWLTLQHEDG
jgi:asparagine synthase (glutamine-hydrolysing)